MPEYSADMADVLLVRHVGPVAIVTLNRPQAMNAFSPQLIVRLHELWQQIRDDDAVRAIVVTGAGTQAFSAGADLRLLVPLLSGRRAPESAWDERLLVRPTMVGDALLKTLDVAKPTIAAVNGVAIGGGFELVQASDLRLMATHAKLALQEIRWGLFPAGGSTVDLPLQLPPARAMELLLTGDAMQADEALHHGFVNRVVATEELMSVAIEMATRVAEFSPAAVAAIRQSVREVRGLTPRAAYARELELAKPVFEAAHAAQGLARFSQT